MANRDTALELAVKAMPGGDPAAIAQAARIFERYLTGDVEPGHAAGEKIGDDVRILKINAAVSMLEGSIVVLARAVHSQNQMTPGHYQAIKQALGMIAKANFVSLRDLDDMIRKGAYAALLEPAPLAPPGHFNKSRRRPGRKKARP